MSIGIGVVAWIPSVIVILPLEPSERGVWLSIGAAWFIGFVIAAYKFFTERKNTTTYQSDGPHYFICGRCRQNIDAQTTRCPHCTSYLDPFHSTLTLLDHGGTQHVLWPPRS